MHPPWVLSPMILPLVAQDRRTAPPQGARWPSERHYSTQISFVEDK